MNDLFEPMTIPAQLSPDGLKIINRYIRISRMNYRISKRMNRVLTMWFDMKKRI